MEFILVTILLVVIFLLLLTIMYHILTTPTRTAQQKCSMFEEKIQLSKTAGQLFATNGYLVQSNSASEMILGTRGSFKRFESVDSAAGRQYQMSPAAITAAPPTATAATAVQQQPVSPFYIPPQPSRAPPKPPVCQVKSIDERIIKLAPQTAPMLVTNPIPRPSPKKQLSAPVGVIPPLTPPVQKIKRQQTNPFLNNDYDEEPSAAVEKQAASTANTLVRHKNPFIDEQEEMFFNFEPKHIENALFGDDASDQLKAAEARIFKLEAYRNQQKHHDENSMTRLLNHIREISPVLDEKGLRIQEGLTNSLKSLDTINSSGNSSSNSSFIKNPPLRSRSMSETQVEFTSSTNNLIDLGEVLHENSINNNPFGNIHKTASDLYLEKYIGQMSRSGKNYNLAEAVVVPPPPPTSSSTVPVSHQKKILIRQNSFGKSTVGGCELFMKRATSDESVCSESSVVLGDLVKINPPTTGSICIGLQYDKVNATDEGCELFVTVLEAKNLVFPDLVDGMDTFVRIYLVPDEKPNMGPLQTKVIGLFL